MEDRSVQYPQRYQLKKVEGTDDIYDLIPAPGEITAEGTLVNKSALLKDETAALFKGLPENPVPDDVFKVLSKAAIVTEGGLSTPSGGEVPGLVTVYGTYTGTGAQSVTLNFGFRPDVVLVGGPGDSQKGVITLLRGTTQNQIMGALNAYCFYFPNVSWGETSVSWSGSATVGLKANKSGQTYQYWALGVKQ